LDFEDLPLLVCRRSTPHVLGQAHTLHLMRVEGCRGAAACKLPIGNEGVLMAMRAVLTLNHHVSVDCEMLPLHAVAPVEEICTSWHIATDPLLPGAVNLAHRFNSSPQLMG
jgi:hypothetical protein